MEEIANIIENSQATIAPIKDMSSVKHNGLSFEKLFSHDVTCDEINSDLFGVSSDQSIGAVDAFSVISIIFTSSIALMMSRNKQLMAHPNRLIFYMCICEGIIAWQALIVHIGCKHFICYLSLADLFN